jgi:hypothetical protein
MCSGRLLLGPGDAGWDVEKQHAAGFVGCPSTVRAYSTPHGGKALVPARREPSAS